MQDDFLKKILAHKRSLLERKKVFFNSLKKKIKDDKFSRRHIFKNAISTPGQINLIAEIKKASPSRGIIRPHFSVLGLARSYMENGAKAISVLTEDKYFLGKPPHIRQVNGHFGVPVLAKDFIIDEAQIYEAFYVGASAILLIAAILDDKTLKHLRDAASSLGLDCLVEIHDEKELERALKVGAEIIGVNNRDLRTFKVDFSVCEHLIPKIPKDKVIVAESGIKTYEEVKTLEKLGSHAVLIGETFLRAADAGKKVQEVMYGKE